MDQKDQQVAKKSGWTLPKPKRPVLVFILVVALVALVIAGLLLARNGASNKAGNNSPAAPSHSSTKEATCNKQMSDPILCKFLATNEQQVPYTAKETSSVAGFSSLTTIKNDNHSSSSVTTSGDKEIAAFVVVAGSVYTKNEATGVWAKTPVKAGIANNNFGILSSTRSEISAPNMKYQKAGKVTCGDLDCYKYQLIYPQASTTQRYFLFDAVNYVLRSFSSSDANVSTSITFSYQPVTIKAPI